MALICCPECGKQVSDKAIACPQCGYPINSIPAQSPLQKNSSKELMMARRAMSEKNYEEAEKYYTQAYEIDPTDWEASFYKALCQMITEKNLNALTNALPNILLLIAGIDDEEKRLCAYSELYTRCEEICKIESERFESSDKYDYLHEPLENFGRTLSKTAPADLPEDIKQKASAGFILWADVSRCYALRSSQRILNTLRNGL